MKNIFSTAGLVQALGLFLSLSGFPLSSPPITSVMALGKTYAASDELNSDFQDKLDVSKTNSGDVWHCDIAEELNAPPITAICLLPIIWHEWDVRAPAISSSESAVL